MCSHEYDKFYSVREMLNYLTPSQHPDIYGLRTISPITNLSALKNLRVLQHPYLFNQFNKSGEQQQVEEVKIMLETADQLEELHFEMR